MLTKIIRPHVILNVAVTADGKTDTVSRKGAAISSAEDLDRVDQLRASVDAIMVGGRTLLENDPRLIIRSKALQNDRIQRGLSPNPVKVGVITRASIKSNSRFLTFGPAQIIIFTTRQTGQDDLIRLQKLGVRCFVLGDERVDLVEAMHQLWEEGIRRLLVEGGGILNSELLRLGFVDEISLFLSPVIFGGMDAPTFVDGQGFELDAVVKLTLTGLEQLPGGGIVLHYLPAYENKNQN
jgi:2,5-diamino-6-hydroxy-4-(5-phosphoribosylamino)pyrimidine 1'-reductase